MTLGSSYPGGNEAQLLQAVSAAVRASDLQRAFEMADAALARGFQHPTFFNARALWLQEQGRYQEALTDFQRARTLTPQDPILLNAIGLCLMRLNRMHDAIASFDASIAIDPKLAQAHYRKGWAYGQTGDHQRVHHLVF